MSLEPEVRQAPYGMSNTLVQLTYFLLRMMFFSCIFYWKTRIWRCLPVKKIHWSSDMSCVVLSCFVQMSFITMANPPRKSAGGVAWYSLSTAQKFKMEPQKTMVSKRNLLFAGLIFRFHVVNHRWFLCWDWKHPCQELTEFLNAVRPGGKGLLVVPWLKTDLSRQISFATLRMSPSQNSYHFTKFICQYDSIQPIRNWWFQCRKVQQTKNRIPGISNINVQMVVSIVWLQILTWETVI